MNILSNINPKSERILFYLCLLCCSVVLSVASLKYMDFVIASGQSIPQEDMATDYVIGIGWAVVLGISIFFWPVSSVNKKLLLWGWLAKMVVTLGFMLLYESHYGLDAYWYFDDSRSGDFVWGGFDPVSINERIINIARFHQLLNLDSYHAIKISFAMFGLIGIYFFYQAVCIFLQRENKKIFFLFVLFPGILFWSSTLGKDPLVFLGIALYAYGVVGFFRLNRLSYLIAIAIGVILALFIRQWLGPIMLFPLFILSLRSIRNRALSFVFIAVTIVAVIFSLGPFMERFKVEVLQDVMLSAGGIMKGYVYTPGGSTQELNVEFGSAVSIIKFLPFGAFTSLFRPLPGEVMNPFGLLAGLENLLLLVLLVLAIKRTRFRELKEPLVMWAILFILTWALVHGIVSSANFGVAVRYKLQILPILLAVLLYLGRRRPKQMLAKYRYLKPLMSKG